VKATPLHDAARRRLLGGFLAVATCRCARAAGPVLVDDHATVVDRPSLDMQWRHPVPGRMSDTTLQGTLRVQARLDLHTWVGQTASLYMALAPVPAKTVHASWRTGGLLLPGTLLSGERRLVYEGRVSVPLLEDTLELTLTTDGRALASSQGLHFHFELET